MNVESIVAPGGGKPSGGPAATKPAPAPATSGTVATQEKNGGGKVALLVGVGLCFALAETRAAPLVMAVLTAGIVYQLLNLSEKGTAK